MDKANHVKCAIIGSGPAGYTAAIYAARAEMEPLMFSGSHPGGQLMTTTDVENYPGYPEGIMGPEMMEDFRKQAERFGTRIVYDAVTKVELLDHPKKLWLGDGTMYTADTVIISTGASAKWLGLPSEQEFANRGVSACAVCDGYFFREQPMAIVGGGDTAAEEALYLAKLSQEVHMLVRRDELRASKIMADRAINHDKIEILWNQVVEEVLGDGNMVTGLKLKSTVDDSSSEMAVGGMFAAIGHTPNTAFLQGKLDMNEKGYIQWTKAFRTNTSVDGVFAAGDVADDYYRQAITSAGTGCMAALDAERYLAEQP